MKISPKKILNYMDSHNKNCAILGNYENQIGYATAKTMVRLIEENKIKYVYEKIAPDRDSYYDVITAYKNASRKERREIPDFRECYLLVMRNIDKMKKIDNNKQIISELNKKVYGKNI